MKPGELNKMGIDNIDSMIDQAIEDLFVPTRPKVEAAPEPAAEEAPKAPAEEKTESLDFEISWEKTPATEKPAAPVFAPEPPPPPPAPAAEELFAAPPPAEEKLDVSISRHLAEAASSMEGEDDEEGAPKMTILKPLYEKLLSLDWEINSANLAAVEKALADLALQTQSNMHAQTGIKMIAVCCKYIRASRTLASPLAMKFLRKSLMALDIFLQPPSPERPSKDALVNELMGLYNDMKEDANRLRAVALRQRQAAQPKAPAVEPRVSAQPMPSAFAPLFSAPAADNPADLRTQIAEVKRTLKLLLETVERIESQM
ncbi:hypothetical protein EPN96_07025 [bacterium]|nr:MAG: hypothetical protein EPN96_07025 [bacterium]